jgi:hypothetical protein
MGRLGGCIAGVAILSSIIGGDARFERIATDALCIIRVCRLPAAA